MQRGGLERVRGASGEPHAWKGGESFPRRMIGREKHLHPLPPLPSAPISRGSHVRPDPAASKSGFAF